MGRWRPMPQGRGGGGVGGEEGAELGGGRDVLGGGTFFWRAFRFFSFPPSGGGGLNCKQAKRRTALAVKRETKKVATIVSTFALLVFFGGCHTFFGGGLGLFASSTFCSARLRTERLLGVGVKRRKRSPAPLRGRILGSCNCPEAGRYLRSSQHFEHRAHG